MTETLTIQEALENLNTLADALSLDEIEVTEEAVFISHKKDEREEEYFVSAGGDEHTQWAIQETFRTVYDYLQFFYEQMQQSGDQKRLVEGINTIMVLVGEAAAHLDQFGVLFKERVTEFDEYKQLQDFYRTRVITAAFKTFAKAPIPKEKTEEDVLPEQLEWEEELQELLQEDVEEIAGVHILNDVEVVKNDHLYELFHLKNEAGHNFFSYELARNIKLACDFGEFAKEYFGDDPLLQIKNWEDRWLHQFSQKILKENHNLIERFYSEAMKYRGMDLVAAVHNSLMALMLAANPRNLIRQFSVKGCHLYFFDFLLFLREALSNREYQKFMMYSIPPGQPFFEDLMEVVQCLSRSLFIMGPEQEELRGALKHMIERVEKKGDTHTLLGRLQHTDYALRELLKHHPNGPVFQALDIVREEAEERHFDPIVQGNIPFIALKLHRGEKQMDLIQMPCPIVQEWINRASVSQEFKTFLQSMHKGENILIFDFQDRTSWREHARAAVLEDLGQQAIYADVLTVVTMAKDTEFYKQTGVYAHSDRSEEFLDHLEQQLSDEATGYFFMPKLKQALFPIFVHQLIESVHKTFFEKAKTLSREERIDFIDLVYHLIELKVIEIIEPSHLAMTSKDGLDLGGSSMIGLVGLLFGGREWSEQELEQLEMVLYGPTLMNRERAIHPETFDRLRSLLQCYESHPGYLKALDPLYKKSTLHWKI